MKVSPPTARAFVGELTRASERIQELELALAKSVKLQSHYAKLLNTWDGGERMVFADAEDWLTRLRAIKEQS